MKNSLRHILWLASVSIIFNFQFSIFNSIQAQELPLSPTATASVITCGPGNDFYTTFGHSAIRITDTAHGLDLVYNYGTFDFDTPHFYWKFAKGSLDYCLSRSPFPYFLEVYKYEQRAVWEQPLNFTQQEINNLFVMLEWNFRPENRYYRYDLLIDNCATRVRDMVESANGKWTIGYDDWEDRSYRYWLHDATSGGRLEWWTFGVDMLLGMPTDHVCNKSEAMFYPLAMMWLYNNATRGGEPLVSPTKQLLEDTRQPLHRSFPPIVVFAVFFAAVVLLSWKRLWPRWADRVLFTIAGLVGCFLIFMWTGTEHYCTKWNLNILWASPFFLLIAIRMAKSPRWFLWLQFTMLVAALIITVFGWPQQINLAAIPLILTLILRTTYLIPKTPQRQQRQR